jgi:cytochrome c553
MLPSYLSARILWRSIASVMLAILFAHDGLSQEPQAVESTIEISKSAREIFRDRCIACHGEKVQEGNLRLDRGDGLIAGGDSGSAIAGGQSRDSLLIARVTARDESRMPPKGTPLSDEQIATLSRFIDLGAPWGEESLKDPRLDHWAWKGLRPVVVPVNGEAGAAVGGDSPIDRFLAVEMSRHNIQPLPRASREVLIRRLSFDLLGIPPTPEEVDDFVADGAADAWERLVDRMLAAPQYGERWARHWLDIAHYADTHGFERDQRRDHAWRYRDWVIDALNADLPYDSFLQQQIAGDVLEDDNPQNTRGTDNTIAASFLAVGPWDYVGQVETPSPVIKRLARADDLDDMVAQVMTSTCGITIHCARCHHHKLDPIQQEEYYALTAIFSGVKRGDRLVSADESQRIDSKRNELKGRKLVIDQELNRRRVGISLADLVGGGNGYGTGTLGAGIDASTGAMRNPNEKKGFLDGVVANRLNTTNFPWIDSVFVPDGGTMARLAISQAGTVAQGIPSTDSKVWDAIRNGPVNSQFSTNLGGIECAPPGRSMLSLHANAGITFRLQKEPLEELRKSNDGSTGGAGIVFTAMVGYFGETASNGADVYVLVDDQVVFRHVGLGRNEGLQNIRHELPEGASTLTLIATDGGNGIGHDQICFIDASLAPMHRVESDDEAMRVSELRKASDELQAELASLPEARRVYGVVPETPAEIRLLHRGNTEDAREVVLPGTVACVGPSMASIAELGSQSTDAQRRNALAKWISSPENPLPARVLVNRLWHHHFGTGLVATPSDFGLGGALPSHPELLDWLANQLQHGGWSMKRMHRMILLSDAYQRTSVRQESMAALNSSAVSSAVVLDAGNRYVWRQNPRRLDAESLRDAILSVSDSLVRSMHGPGYRDFDYQEEYAPVYQHRVLETPDVFRRSIYRFVVRTTPHPFLTSLDCPNPATLTPVRNTTTTAIQSLATLNNAFVLQQSDRFAMRLQHEVGGRAEAQAERAIRLAFGRKPTQAEIENAARLIESAGLFQLCRILLNTNEFVYVD